MENLRKINEFLNAGSGYDSGAGSGHGYGSGSGHGSGSGSGCGTRSGSGSSTGYGSSSGYGSGYSDGIATFNGFHVFKIDGIQTLIDHINRNVARGRILKDDLSTVSCYVVKNGGIFAHGETLREAMKALEDKIFEGSPEEDRIAAFVATHDGRTEYPNADFFDWHHKLTGSCKMGREAFAEAHCVDLSGKMSVMEFIKLTEHEYMGHIIKKLRPYYTVGGKKEQ